MKRLMPSSLIDFLQANPTCLKADLFVIGLPNGQVLYATEGQFDITLTAYVASPESGTPGWTGSTTTFYASKYGKWSRGAITSAAGFDLSASEMSLTCVPQQSTAFPGLSLGILGAAFNGLFDACTVGVYTVYMPVGSYGDVSNGVETKFVGFIEKIKEIDRTHVEFTCEDPLYLLNQKIPARVIQSGCPWGFCDANCTLTASDYTISFTAKTGSTQSILTPATAFTQAAGYFSQGVLTCVTGDNAGLSVTVKVHDSTGNLETVIPFLLPVTAGDTFTVIKGCDKSSSMCSKTVKPDGSSISNLVHFGGAPLVPQPLSAV